jgi:hypothetical protein
MDFASAPGAMIMKQGMSDARRFASSFSYVMARRD